tara:strand:+ start:199 stop:1749 length:1551 start_codon:yes stop_codon:yes gene_type:complete
MKTFYKNYSLSVLLILGISIINTSCQQQAKEKQEGKNKKDSRPNIIILYADDLGYGDLSCYGATNVATPNIDKLAENGLRFTDAHSTAATCSPSRYSLLTGIYGFRKKAGILSGDAPLLISPKTPTLPSMLQKSGYKTGVVGKWHLGLGSGPLDWNKEIKPGPLEIGFDYSFLIPATGDRVPSVYVENHHVVGLDSLDPIKVDFKNPIDASPKAYENPELLRYASDRQHSEAIINGVGRIGYMSGGNNARWKDEEFPDLLTNKASAFIDRNKEQPFFLYYSFHDIHVPRLPNPRFKGATKMGPRGDAIAQMDWCVGEIVKQLEDLGIADNTLILFSSDNGPVLNDGYEDQSVELIGNHKPSGPFRGGKYSAYEAGTRMPTIAYWPNKIKKGLSNALLSQIDLYASFASLVGIKLQDGEAPDSQNLVDAWLGKSPKGRTFLVEESLVTSLRKENWKYIPPTNKKTNHWLPQKGIEGGYQNTPQLYDLENDVKELNNLAALKPELVDELKKVLKEIIN